MFIVSHKRLKSPAPQRGAVMILFVVGLLSILGIAGLALDGSHQMLNKSRLQNTVDAAALKAAKVLDETADTGQATAAAQAMFTVSGDDAGNNELGAALAGMTINVQYSATVAPFVPGTLPADYVRVTATDFEMTGWLTAVRGRDTKSVSASAVAGPSPTILNACKLAPLIICADEAAGPPNYGYQDDQVVVLKSGSQGPGSEEIGAGNYQWAALGGSGADVARDNLAGAYEGDCVEPGSQVPTEPGNMAGPARDAIGTRFNIFNGTMKGTEDRFPPDIVTDQPNPPLKYDSDADVITQASNPSNPITDTTQIDFSYDRYNTEVAAQRYDVLPTSLGGTGKGGRRILPSVIAQCDGNASGRNEVTALAIGCFFLLQEMPTSQTGKESYIFGEFIEKCPAAGRPGPAPGVGPGPYIIQLYKDSSSIDS